MNGWKIHLPTYFSGVYFTEELIKSFYSYLGIPENFDLKNWSKKYLIKPGDDTTHHPLYSLVLPESNVPQTPQFKVDKTGGKKQNLRRKQIIGR